MEVWLSDERDREDEVSVFVQMGQLLAKAKLVVCGGHPPFRAWNNSVG